MEYVALIFHILLSSKRFPYRYIDSLISDICHIILHMIDIHENRGSLKIRARFRQTVLKIFAPIVQSLLSLLLLLLVLLSLTFLCHKRFIFEAAKNSCLRDMKCSHSGILPDERRCDVCLASQGMICAKCPNTLTHRNCAFCIANEIINHLLPKYG